jgi:flagellar L-ring protein precursor FlgH
LAGLESSISNILPNSVDPASLASIDSSSSTSGSGTITREESINIRLAAVVLQVLPNGNLVIAGRQEVRVNYELRELTVTGVIRPQDIGSDNTVDWDKIAEARISYGGRGTISNVQQPRYGQQIFDIIFPF